MSTESQSINHIPLAAMHWCFPLKNLLAVIGSSHQPRLELVSSMLYKDFHLNFLMCLSLSMLSPRNHLVLFCNHLQYQNQLRQIRILSKFHLSYLIILLVIGKDLSQQMGTSPLQPISWLYHLANELNL